MQLERRVAHLEGAGKQSNIGDLLDSLAVQDSGGVIDWDSITISAALAQALDDLDLGEAA